MQTQALRWRKFVSPGLHDVAPVIATALFLVFVFFLICAGMWVVAAHTGFVGAVGHARKA